MLLVNLVKGEYMKKAVIAIALVITAALGVGVLEAAPQVAASTATDSVKDGIKATGQSDGTSLKGGIKTVTNILLFVLGAIAVIMIIIGGIRYTTSNGDSSQITSAKNTILYAVVGLVVALLAYAIVNFIVDTFVKA
jgi:hypothetical protein